MILPIQEISKDVARFAIDYKEEPNKGFLGKNAGDELEELGYTFYKMKKDIIEVGGDFYDFFFIDEGHMAVVVADVSGKSFICYI